MAEVISFSSIGNYRIISYSEPLTCVKQFSGNNHLTVKPVQLMRYLCRLLTPKHGLVLDPFMGSGTTGVAALLEGFTFIGIDSVKENVELANQRIYHVDVEHD